MSTECVSTMAGSTYLQILNSVFANSYLHLQDQRRQSRNAYASKKEMTRNNTTKEETSDCLPSLYAVTVLAGEFNVCCYR